MHTRTQQSWQQLQIIVSNERMNSIKQKISNQFLHTSAQVIYFRENIVIFGCVRFIKTILAFRSGSPFQNSFLFEKFR